MNARIRFITLIFCLLTASVVWPDNETDKDTEGLSIVVTSLDITNEALKVQYEIINNSEQNIWIFFGKYYAGVQFDPCCETYITEDGRTLALRSSLKPRIESKGLGPPREHLGIYIRLRPGERQSESISREIPFYAESLTKQIQQEEQELKYATRLAIELEYYPGDPPEIILRMLDLYYINFKRDYEPKYSRNEELLISEHSWYKGEKRILSTTVDNLSIPYKLGRYEASNYTKIDPPDLASCVKIEFEYQPSILEHWFPYAGQQNLLSLEEKEYLDSGKIVITDPNKIKIFADDVRKRKDFGGVGVRYRSYIDVTCYYEDKHPSSFTIYHDNTISIEDYNLTRVKESSREGLTLVFSQVTLSILKEIIPQIQEIDFRMQCAANMEDLWYRLCFHHGRLTKLKEGPSIRTLNPYPDSKTWCDAINKGKKFLICPVADDGKCHYAMNPNCEPNSPDDMVLLFETKAGWNQNGGPELFTFDNHDPKRPAPNVLSRRDSGGGCVLLNDGTVKFIRTKEELNNLRWK